MSWVQVSNVSLAFGERVLFEEANLSLEKGSRAALAGANGSGKTTLLKIIAGQIKPDTGSVIRRKDSRISYLPQSGIIHEHNTLYQEAEQAFQYWHDLSKEIENIYSKLETVQEGNPQAGPLLEELHALQEQVERSGFYRREER
ncbi:MAG TPA: ATP-binding cassette domain-containing protein, partial [Spirochaetales bacterium]|nr:ATP-binding cassette domain-containing protein [Spirochaetales bacterium]